MLFFLSLSLTPALSLFLCLSVNLLFTFRKLDWMSTNLRRMLCTQHRSELFAYRIVSPKWLHSSVSYWIYFYRMISNIWLKNILLHFQNELSLYCCHGFAVHWKCCDSRKESDTHSFILHILRVHGGKHLIFRTWLLHPSYLKAFSLNFK